MSNMDCIEEIAGATKEQLQEYDWPTPSSTEDYFVHPSVPPRGSVRLRAGRFTGRDEIQKKWLAITAKLKAEL